MYDIKNHRKIMAVFEAANVCDINTINGDSFTFPVYLTKEMAAAEIGNLEIGVRSYNCLRRAGYSTIKDLVEGINGSEDLRGIRNCGNKSVDEIMESLFYYQYSMLDPKKKADYINRVIEMNKDQ